MTRPAPHVLLCEACGYPLQGLEALAHAACPECGEPVATSQPLHRTGPAWQNNLTPGSWLVTVGALLSRPRLTFRTMRVDGSNLSPRLFLLSMASLVMLFWGAFTFLVRGEPLLLAWLHAMLAFNVTVALTYIEAVGVTLFSLRRGWRIPFALAERLACYAGAGWPLAAVGLACFVAWSGYWQTNELERLAYLMASDQWTAGQLMRLIGRALLLVGKYAAVLLAFESFVYLGVRQCRWANGPSNAVELTPDSGRS